jgi:hypothetical protein
MRKRTLVGSPHPRRRRAVLASAVVSAVLIPLLATTSAAAATVSSRALPTAQINGVAVAQVVVGSTVYVGGAFTTARPAGAAPGTHTVKRINLLAYDLTTGKLKSWAPKTNGEVRSLARSGDGRTIYAAGTFTRVNGHVRTRVVALAASTGGVRAAFHPVVNSSAYSVAVKGSTVYVGGHFTSANSRTRSRAAAFATGTGGLRPWRPKANGDVLAVVVSKTGRSAVLAGRFSAMNGRTQRGSQRVGTGSGTTDLAWRVNDVVGNNGSDAAIWSLSSDGTYVYGTGYSYHPHGVLGKRLEGTFAATWGTGTIHWIEDCHGDTYSAAEMGGAVYVAGHPHDCRDVPGGFVETDPITYHRALAFTRGVAGTLKANTVSGYSNFGGEPAPALLAWRPDFNAGTATGLGQGPWNVVTSAGYVLYAGEFTRVNGRLQQGLVRFSG